MASSFGPRRPSPATMRVRMRLPGQPKASAGRLADLLFRAACTVAAASVIALAALLTVFLVIQSWPAMTAIGGSFFLTQDWDPVKDHYGALAFIFGTLATSAIAMVIAVPLSVGTAAFLAEIAPSWLRRSGSFLIELLAAIPSVVYGFWGVAFLAPNVVQKFFNVVGGPNTGGVGILSAGLILSIMIVPYITAISYDVCRAVPRAQREGALALGATRWQTIRQIVLPYARPGIIGACFLALGRALGETMAVTMLIGNSPKIIWSIFATGDSIASVIANQLGNTPKDLTRSALVELGLTLFLVTVAVNSLARLLIWRTMARARTPRRRTVPITAAHLANGDVAARPRPPMPRGNRGAERMNRLMTGVLFACLVLTLGPLFPILGYIAYRGVRSVNLDFFTHLPIDTPPGLGNALLGSGILVGLATIFAVPIGILAAVYLAEYRSKRLGPAVRFIGELLGGVPSIIIGVFSYALIVMPTDFSAWAGAFALGVMMVPIVMRASEESLKLVPQTLRNASYALGAANWQTVARVIVPAALPAIVTGVFLAIARIAGETAPLLLTAYNSNYWPGSPSDRTPFLTYYIYHYALSDSPEEQRLAWAAALVLLAVVMILNVGIRLLTGKRVILASRAD